jgi:hypothetical protein
VERDHSPRLLLHCAAVPPHTTSPSLQVICVQCYGNGFTDRRGCEANRPYRKSSDSIYSQSGGVSST